MAALGLFMLGVFVGYVVIHGLHRIPDWKEPSAIYGAVLSAAISGGVFTFIQYLGGRDLGDSLFWYPLGLCYGALGAGLEWVKRPKGNKWVAGLHIVAFAVATLLLLFLLLSPTFRSWLPR